MTHDHRQGDLCNACNKLLYISTLENRLCMASQTNVPFTMDAHLMVKQEQNSPSKLSHNSTTLVYMSDQTILSIGPSSKVLFVQGILSTNV